MKTLQILAVLLVSLSGLLVSCSGSDPKPGGFTTQLNPADTLEGRYLKNKAESGLAWKTRAEEIVRQSKEAGTFDKNEFEINRAYARVDTSLQLWANAVARDAKGGKPVAETQQMQNQVESSLKALGEAAEVPGTRGWKRDLVVGLVTTLFPISAPLVTVIDGSLEQAEAERLRKRFIKAHELAPPAQLQPDPPTSTSASPAPVPVS